MGVYNSPVVLRKTSNVENVSVRPSAPESSSGKGARQSVAAAIIRGSSQRRRARANGPRAQRYVAEQAKRRKLAHTPPINISFPTPVPSPSTSKDVEMKDGTRPTSTTTVILPRHLSRPTFKPVPHSRVASIEPQLADLPIEYIQDKLAELGPDMVKVLTSVEASTSTNTLPRELSILVQDLASDLPTHMLAVYSRQPTGGRRRVTMYPTHSIVWAANCATLPPLPSSHPSAPDASPSARITVPVVPLCLPDPASFPHLSSYIYAKRVDVLLAALFPSAPPSNLQGKDAATEFAWALAREHNTAALVDAMTKVRGLWLNVCALGIFDDGMWVAIDLAWEVLVNALSISVGAPLATASQADAPLRAQL